MEFIVGQYHINICIVKNYTKYSTDNVHKYDFVYAEKTEFHYSTTIGIEISNGTEMRSVVIRSNGGATGIHETSQIIEIDRLLICCSESIYCLSIPDLKLLWKTKVDESTCFEIFKYQNSYIIHGELEISRIDSDGKILWQQSGADIFTTLEGKNDFLITDNYILATDWENRRYKFDFDGKNIS